MSVSPTDAKILIVDDDKSLRSLLSLVLEEEGYAVTEAQNGEDCLRFFSQLQPDLVLLDAVMPDMDGFDCCAQLRSLPEGQNTPVLMITFLDDQESIERAFAVGATDYITKPIHWPVLFQRLQRLMVASQAIAQAEQIQGQLLALQNWHRFYQQILSAAHRLLEPAALFAEILQESLDYFAVSQAVFVYPQASLWLTKSSNQTPLSGWVADADPQKLVYYPQTFEILSPSDPSLLTEAQAQFLASFQAQTAIAIPLSRRSSPLAYLFFLESYPRFWKEAEIEAFQELGKFWSLLLG